MPCSAAVAPGDNRHELPAGNNDICHPPQPSVPAILLAGCHNLSPEQRLLLPDEVAQYAEAVRGIFHQGAGPSAEVQSGGLNCTAQDFRILSLRLLSTDSHSTTAATATTIERLCFAYCDLRALTASSAPGLVPPGYDQLLDDFAWKRIKRSHGWRHGSTTPRKKPEGGGRPGVNDEQ